MLQMLMSNISTIIVSVLLLTIVVFIIRNLYHDKKTGKSSCGSGCGGCASSGLCHGKKNALVEQYKSGIKGV